MVYSCCIACWVHELLKHSMMLFVYKKFLRVQLDTREVPLWNYFESNAIINLEYNVISHKKKITVLSLITFWGGFFFVHMDMNKVADSFVLLRLSELARILFIINTHNQTLFLHFLNKKSGFIPGLE